MSSKDREWIKRAKIIELTHGVPPTLDAFKRHLERLQPDAIHLIGTSHSGVMNYRTRIGPGAEDDALLRQQIAAARALGVRIIASHSGVGNKAAGDAHPEWVRLRSDGTRCPEVFAGWQMDLLSPYPEEWFLAQVEEMLRDFEIDGLWVDGDGWYVRPCYSPEMLRRFKAETGLDAPPCDESGAGMAAPTSASIVNPRIRLPDDPALIPAWRAWMAFNRRVFRDFQRKTGELCHRYGAVYASNGTHSIDSGPEPVPDTMDYLSHDIPEFDGSGCFMASLKARFNGTQGVPHDVMTWDYNSRNPWGGIQAYPKGRRQFRCEVASALANGALWNNWTSRPHAGNAWDIADFIRQRQDVLRGTESAAEIALLHTASSFFVHSLGFFTTAEGNRPVWGAARALQYGGHTFDVVNEANLPRLLPQYRLIILAGQTHLPAETVRLLEQFVAGGGTLLAAGRSGMADGEGWALADLLGLQARPEADDAALTVAVPPEWVDEDPAPEGAGLCGLGMAAPRCGIELRGAEAAWNALSVAQPGGRREAVDATGWLWADSGYAEDPGRPFLTRRRHGQGQAWYVAAEVFGHYDKMRYFGLRNLILNLVDRALPEPMARAAAARPVELAARRRGDGALICHLVNLTVEGMNNATETQYPRHAPSGPVEVALRLPARPARAERVGGGPFEARWEAGVLRCALPEVDVMESILVMPG